MTFAFDMSSSDSHSLLLSQNLQIEPYSHSGLLQIIFILLTQLQGWKWVILTLGCDSDVEESAEDYFTNEFEEAVSENKEGYEEARKRRKT